MIKKIVLYLAVVLLLIGTASSLILKQKYENEFLASQSGKLDSFIENTEEASPEQKAEIGNIAKDYKYQIYTYNALAFITLAGAIALIFRRKKILAE